MSAPRDLSSVNRRVLRAVLFFDPKPAPVAYVYRAVNSPTAANRINALVRYGYLARGVGHPTTFTLTPRARRALRCD